jgi:gas vesicle protein
MGGNERNSYDSGIKRDESINSKDFLIGALVGGVVGSLAALLFAPKSGKELRGKLNNQAYQLMEKTDTIRHTALSKSGELATTVKEKTNTISNTVAKQSTELVNKVKGLKPGSEPESLTSSGNPVDQLFEQNPHADIQKKLEETKRAFDETEKRLNY